MRLNLFLLALLSLLLAFCAREVIIDLPNEPPKLVAVCHFTDAQNFRAKISLSKSVHDDSNVTFPQDVDATLSVNGTFWDRLIPDTLEKGKITYWESHPTKIAHSGVEYSFSVRVPGYPTIQASSKIPYAIKLDPIVLTQGDMVVESLGEGMSELRVPLELRLSEFPTEGYFFAFNLSHVTDVYQSLNPMVLEGTREGRSNFLTDGRTFSLLHDIPEPVVLINENYWAEGNRTLHLVARIPFDPETERPRRIFIEWRTLSKEFYRYHLSLSRQGGNLPFSDPDAVFNNIDGGFGNFSGYAVSTDTVEFPNF